MDNFVKGFAIRYPNDYNLIVNYDLVNLNQFIGKTITIEHDGRLACCHCSRPIKKAYHSGYCFPCFQSLARCDMCVMKPELCHYHKGTCREPDWGLSHCMQPHIVYVSYTSCLKVGLTRKERLMNRWLEQGALGACKLVETKTRYQAGIIESAMAKSMHDKTNWRKMLAQEALPLDIWHTHRDVIMNTLHQAIDTHEDLLDGIVLYEPEWFVLDIEYETPEKIVSMKPKKDSPIVGVLEGFRGHYLVLNNGVVNLRGLISMNIELSSS